MDRNRDGWCGSCTAVIEAAPDGLRCDAVVAIVQTADFWNRNDPTGPMAE
jgi:hypothetical protein